MAQDSSGKMVWFLAGVSIGATLAVLYAPQPGEDTRRVLSEKGRELYDRGREIAEDAAGNSERMGV